MRWMWLAPGPAAAAAAGAPDQAAVSAVIHAVVCGLAGADVAHDAPLSQAGLDSLAFVELRNELSRCCWDMLACLFSMSFHYSLTMHKRSSSSPVHACTIASCRALGLELPGTLVFDHPTISALAAYTAPLMQARMLGGRGSPGGAAAPPGALRPALTQPARHA